MDEGNVTVLVDAKEEYTKQLISILKNCIYQGIKSIYMDAKDICNQDNTPDNVLMTFQDLLSRIPKWSQDIINKEYERISNVSKCDYIDDLLKVVYVSHIKILTIVHSAQRNKKISIKVPSGSHFIHLCYIECAREFWKDPYYFSDRVSKYEHQKNMRDSEIMIAECIMETIRKQLPVRHILKEFLNEPDEDIDEEDEDIKEPSKKKYLKKLETVVKKELKSTSKNGDLGDINIELIRKVIREEMNSRPETDKIKKELVDTVVEKIVEKTQEGLQEGLQEGFTNPDKPITSLNENMKDSVIEILKANINEDIKDSVIEIVKEDMKETVIEVVKEDTVKDTVIEVVKEDTAKDKKTVIFDIDKKEKTKNKSASLESLLNENVTIIDNEDEDEDENNTIDTNIDVDNLITNTINSDVNNSVVDNKKEIKNSLENMEVNKKNLKSTLVINNIDEINLNLDELDNDLELDANLDNELNLDEMQSVDLSKKTISKKDDKNEKTDPNTKYIFFKDVE